MRTHQKSGKYLVSLTTHVDTLALPDHHIVADVGDPHLVSLGNGHHDDDEEHHLDHLDTLNYPTIHKSYRGNGIIAKGLLENRYKYKRMKFQFK